MQCYFISKYGCTTASWEDYAIRSHDNEPQIMIKLDRPICLGEGCPPTYYMTTHKKHMKKYLQTIPLELIKRLIVC